MVCSPLFPCTKSKGSPQDSFAATFPARDAVATLPCPTGIPEPPQSRPTSHPRRNAVRRPGDALPASSPPLGEPDWHLRTPPRHDRACTQCMALGQEHLVRKAWRRSGVAALSRTGAVECRIAKWRTGNDHRNAPRIATLRPGSLAQDLRPSGHPCQELARSATGVWRAARRAARRRLPRPPGHDRSTRVRRFRACSMYR